MEELAVIHWAQIMAGGLYLLSCLPIFNALSLYQPVQIHSPCGECTSTSVTNPLNHANSNKFLDIHSQSICISLLMKIYSSTKLNMITIVLNDAHPVIPPPFLSNFVKISVKMTKIRLYDCTIKIKNSQSEIASSEMELH